VSDGAQSRGRGAEFRSGVELRLARNWGLFPPLTFDPTATRIALLSASPRAAARATIVVAWQWRRIGCGFAWTWARCGRPNSLEFGVHRVVDLVAYRNWN
jgi:hypothetical protein